jgi:hypothetical protein
MTQKRDIDKQWPLPTMGVLNLDRHGDVTYSQPHTYLYAIAEGDVTDHYPWYKYGLNDDVGTSIEDVWTPGGTYSYFAAAEKLKVSSSDADDDATGSGAQTVEIQGLDKDHQFQSEVITMSTGASVQTQYAYLRVFRATVLTAGATGSNEGVISVKNNAETTTMAQMTLLPVQPQAPRLKKQR